MKKFLIFLTSIVIVICLGLTTYYFLRNDEVISFKTREIYCNVGDIIDLDDLGYTVFKKNNKTSYNYNASSEQDLNKISYNANKGYYVAKNGGDAKIVITTSNKGFKNFEVVVHIGDGLNNPYYITSQKDLEKIGAEESALTLDKKYQLLNDINLIGEFTPIGNDQAFTGTFDGNNKTISGLNISTSRTYAGLFATLGKGSRVENLTIKNATINGSFAYVGTVAGEIKGAVNRVQVVNANITNNQDDAITAAFAGKLYKGSKIYMSYATGNVKCDSDIGVAAGFVGIVEEANIKACYANVKIDVNYIDEDNSAIAGFVGRFVIGNTFGVISQSYSVSSCGNVNFANFIFSITTSIDFNTENANGLKYLIGNYSQGQQENVVKYANTTVNDLFSNGYFNKSKSLFLIVALDDLSNNNNFIYYAIDATNKRLWNNNVWNFNTKYPTLTMSNVTIENPVIDYYVKDATNNIVGDDSKTNEENRNEFVNILQSSETKITLNSDIDFENTIINPFAIENKIIDGAGFTIKNVVINADVENGNVGFFSTVKGCTVKNLKFENIYFTNTIKNSAMGTLAGEVLLSTDGTTSSELSNITISMVKEVGAGNSNYFGGIVAKLNEGCTLINSEITNLTLNNDYKAKYIGGVVAKNDGKVKNVTVNANLIALNNAAGIVAENNGTIDGASGDVKIMSNGKTVENGHIIIGGVAAVSSANVQNIDNFKINITLNNNTVKAIIGGIVGSNSGYIVNSKINGNGISLGEEIGNVIYVGGVAAENYAVIDGVSVNVTNIGTCVANKNVYTGGVVAVDSAEQLYEGNHERNANITKVQINISDDGVIAGNYVAGIVAKMTKSNSTVDQVYISGKLEGDKFVAGACYEMGDGNNGVGTINNIQLINTINAKARSTRSSLLTLIFPAGAKLTNATVDSKFEGDGYFYRETWTDYGANPESFGYNTGVNNASFNIYAPDGNAGSMQSVVINNSNYGKTDIKTGSFATVFLGMGISYTNSDSSSYVRDVNAIDFRSKQTYIGSYNFYVTWWDNPTLTYSKPGWLQAHNTYTKNLSFFSENNTGVWVESIKGIELNFLNK